MRHFFHQLIVHILTQIQLRLLYKILLLVPYRVGHRIFFTFALCIVFLINLNQTFILLILLLHLRVELIGDHIGSCPIIGISIESLALVAITVSFLFPFSYSLDSLFAFFLICFIFLHKLKRTLSFQADGVNVILKVYSLEVLAENLVATISFMSLLKESHIVRKINI